MTEGSQKLPAQDKHSVNVAGRKLLFLVADSRFFLSHRLPIAMAAKAAGYDVTIVCPDDDASYRISEAGLKFCPLAIKRGGLSAMSDLLTMYRLLRLLLRVDPDIVHMVATKPVIYGGIVSRMLNIPTLAAISGLGYAFSQESFRRKLLRRVLLTGYRLSLKHKNAHVVVQNQNDLRVLANEHIIYKDQFTQVSGSGVDLSKIAASELPTGKTVFVLPARMLRDKGVLEFVAAAGILKERGVAATFRLLGKPDPSNPSSIANQNLEQWNADGLVEWLGYAEDINLALAKTHVCVLPSYMEGFPKTIIDAAAAGRMSVVSDVPGCRDAIVPGSTGLLCKVRDAVDLARVLEIVARDRDLQSRMGRAARLHAEAEFDIHKVCEIHLQLYKQQLQHKESNIDRR